MIDLNEDAFRRLAAGAGAAVVLLEGTRKLSPENAPRLTAFAERLAREFPELRFRTGNALGSDLAFAAGVERVDACRLEFILPYQTHRAGQRPAVSYSASIREVPGESLARIAETTVAASPHHERTAVNYRTGAAAPRQRAVAELILRDTLKVTGDPALGLARPIAGFFYVWPEDPLSGGTGHTIRVCREVGVPVIHQGGWSRWFGAASVAPLERHDIVSQ